MKRKRTSNSLVLVEDEIEKKTRIQKVGSNSALKNSTVLCLKTNMRKKISREEYILIRGPFGIKSRLYYFHTQKN